jgi:hypothetical protein
MALRQTVALQFFKDATSDTGTERLEGCRFEADVQSTRFHVSNERLNPQVLNNVYVLMGFLTI